MSRLDNDYIINNKGEKVLKEYVNDIDLKRNELVEDVFSEIEKLEKKMIQKKKEILNKIRNYMKEIAKIKNVKNINNGELISSIILKSYDETKEIKVYRNDILSIPDDQLKLAEKCFLNYIKRKKEEGRLEKEIEEIVKKAFCLDRKRGIGKTRILDLIKVKIDDKEWAKGVKIIKDAIGVNGSREYINFKRRAKVGDKLETINFNFSSM